MVAKITEFDSTDPSIDSHQCLGAAKLRQPILDDVHILRREVVADFVHAPIIVYKRIQGKLDSREPTSVPICQPAYPFHGEAQAYGI